ncbi:hypothetical protein ACTXG7_24460 [Mycolicibacterium sp. Dal123E01]|uniref:hypothetical protein n=1 Tax=Mycolicibacterium sp. Dal123E01 TaxID=3457578 RepID=UPI00403ED593
MKLTAAATATIVTAAMVFTPHHAEPEIPRALHVSAIQLQAIASTAPAHTTPARSHFAAATPQVNLSLPTPQQALGVVGTIAVAAAWYAAFPVTLPTSFVLAAVWNVFVTGVSMRGPTVDPVFVLQWGLPIFAVAPFILASPLLTSLPATATSAAAQVNSSVVTDPSTPSGDRRATSDGAGSRRKASASTTAERTPSAHRTAPSTTKASSQKKPSATAGSARAVKSKA